MESRSKLVELTRRFVPPRGLDRSRPREVRLTSAGKALVITAVLFFAGAAGAGIGLHRIALRQAEARRLLADQGIVAVGEVTRLWRGSDDSKQPWVAYRFDAGGRPYEGRSKMSLRNWRALQPGAALSIRFVRSAPDRNVLAGSRPDAMPFSLPPIVASLLVVGGWLCLLPIRIERRLLMDGRPAPAVVLTHRKVHGTHGSTHRSMTYEFPLLSGAVATGKSATSSKPPAVGSVICVVYDPDQPTRSKPYPLTLVRV